MQLQNFSLFLDLLTLQFSLIILYIDHTYFLIHIFMLSSIDLDFTIHFQRCGCIFSKYQFDSLKFSNDIIYEKKKQIQIGVYILI